MRSFWPARGGECPVRDVAMHDPPPRSTQPSIFLTTFDLEDLRMFALVCLACVSCAVCFSCVSMPHAARTTGPPVFTWSNCLGSASSNSAIRFEVRV